MLFSDDIGLMYNSGSKWVGALHAGEEHGSPCFLGLLNTPVDAVLSFRDDESIDVVLLGTWSPGLAIGVGRPLLEGEYGDELSPEYSTLMGTVLFPWSLPGLARVLIESTRVTSVEAELVEDKCSIPSLRFVVLFLLLRGLCQFMSRSMSGSYGGGSVLVSVGNEVTTTTSLA